MFTICITLCKDWEAVCLKHCFSEYGLVHIVKNANNLGLDIVSNYYYTGMCMVKCKVSSIRYNFTNSMLLSQQKEKERSKQLSKKKKYLNW